MIDNETYDMLKYINSTERQIQFLTKKSKYNIKSKDISYFFDKVKEKSDVWD